MIFTLKLPEKMIEVTHLAETTKVSFQQYNNQVELEVVGTSNNKKTKTIDVFVVKCFKDAAGNILKSERKDYTITNEQEYLAFYNTPTVTGEGLGFTEYMHALNGAIARCPELGGNDAGEGIRIFNADGTIRNTQS
jgi:hypothetical protein